MRYRYTKPPTELVLGWVWVFQESLAGLRGPTSKGRGGEGGGGGKVRRGGERRGGEQGRREEKATLSFKK